MKVVLFSGGLDSTVLLWANREDSIALSFTYGSKHNEAEGYAAMTIARLANVERRVVHLPLDDIGFKSDLLKSGGAIPEGHYADQSMKATVVPFRNGIMLSLAVGLAESWGAGEVLYAAHGGDHPIYPDCRPEFVTAMDAAATAGTDTHVRVRNPYADWNKTDIVRAANRAPLDLSWSCYQPVLTALPIKGLVIHCGRCGTCVERKEAFAGAGVIDPTRYYES